MFMFKLSSEPMDVSRIGKISAEERELLLARQKLLDADDQMASFLAMQHQIKQLQDELGEIKLKLTQLSAGSPMAELPATSAVAQQTPENSKREKIIFFVSGLVLAILLLLLGMRYYNRIHLQRLSKETWDSVPEEPVSIKTPPSSARPASAGIQSGNVKKARPAASANSKKSDSASTPSPAHVKSQEELSEADAVIEEAELYSTYGHPDRAILMLQELIQQQPGKTEAWELLLFIFFSQKKPPEFERTARDFMGLNTNEAAWKKIQALGRSLDRDNPMYADGSTPSTAASTPPELALGKRRLIGNILVETGVLSAQDIVRYLDDFDPKRDGRIGEYLVSRQAITDKQLQAALQLQQSGEVTTEVVAVAAQTTEQSIDQFLPDSSPKRDERLDEYMKMDTARKNKPKKS